jgi:hypothetical protein
MSVASPLGSSVNTLRAQLILPSEPNFCNLFELPATKSTQKSIYFTPYLENCEINSIKSDSPRAFQQHQECPQISIQFSVLSLFNFHWEIGSIINCFHTIGLNNLKPSRCTLTYRELSKYTKSVAWSTVMVWEISAWQNKTNCLAS